MSIYLSKNLVKKYYFIIRNKKKCNLLYFNLVKQDLTAHLDLN